MKEWLYPRYGVVEETARIVWLLVTLLLPYQATFHDDTSHFRRTGPKREKSLEMICGLWPEKKNVLEYIRYSSSCSCHGWLCERVVLAGIDHVFSCSLASLRLPSWGCNQCSLFRVLHSEGFCDWSLILCGHHLEILNGFIFEFVFVLEVMWDKEACIGSLEPWLTCDGASHCLPASLGQALSCLLHATT